MIQTRLNTSAAVGMALPNLQYTPATSPAVLTVGTNGTLTLVVTNQQDTVYNLAAIGVSMLADDPNQPNPSYAAVDLLSNTAPANCATAVSSDGTQWQASGGTTANSFVFTPAAGGYVAIAGQSLTLTFANLPISTIPGTALVTVAEWSEPSPSVPVYGGSPPAPPTGGIQIDVPKFPQGFTLGYFEAIPANVGQGGGTTLSWATTQATLTISYGTTVVPASGGTPLPPSGSLPIADLQQTTTFTLLATDSSGAPSIESQATVSVNDALPVINSFTGLVQNGSNGIELVLTWDATGADHCEITGQSPWYVGAASITLPLPFVAGMAYVLTAYNAQGASVTQPVTISWASTVTLNTGQGTQPTGMASYTNSGVTTLYVNDQQNGQLLAFSLQDFSAVPGTPVAVGSQPDGLIVSPDGSRLFVINYGTGYNGTLAVLSATNFQALCDPLVLNETSGYQIVVSPDGNHLLALSGEGTYPNSTSNIVVISPMANPPAILTSCAVSASTNDFVCNDTYAFLGLEQIFNSACVQVYDVSTLALVTTLPVPGNDAGPNLAIHPDGSVVYSMGLFGAIGAVSTSPPFAAVVSPITTNFSFYGAVVTADGTQLVGLTKDSLLVAYDSTTLAQIGEPISLGSTQVVVAADAGTRVYVSNPAGSAIMIVTLPPATSGSTAR